MAGMSTLLAPAPTAPWTWQGPVAEPADFANILAILRRERPARPTLFEFFMNHDLAERLSGEPPAPVWSQASAPVFTACGYDYITTHASDFGFHRPVQRREQSLSANEGFAFQDRAGFEAYQWLDPEASDAGMLDRIAARLRPGMKLIAFGPGGVLENAIGLVGYQRLCELLSDDPELVTDIFAAIGSRLVRYYERAVRHPMVGAIISNDDWGFKTQTMFSHRQMRRLVFPWHERIVAVAHAAGRPAILHSCGCLGPVMDDIIDGMHYDGKHSYEDNIMPVEEAYERWGRRIAILGGLDLDFMVRATPEAIHRRACAMLERTRDRGGYGLGTGNSVPSYVPDENYLAMVEAAVAGRRRG